MDSIESILLRYASHFLKSRNYFTLLLASLIMRHPNLTTMMESVADSMSDLDFKVVCGVIIYTRDTVACELFLRYAGPFLQEQKEPEFVSHLWHFAQLFCCSSGIKHIALESAQWSKFNAQQLLIPAVIGGDVAFVKALQQNTGFFSVNDNPLRYPLAMVSWAWVSQIFKAANDPWSRQNQDDWVRLPLLVAIHLARPIELIAHLIESGALLYRDHRRIEKHEPSILELMLRYPTLDYARERFYESHLLLREIVRCMITSKQKYARIFRTATLRLAGEMLGLRVKEYGPEAKVLEGPLGLPASLQTEANFVKWKEGLISLLEEATVSQLYCPASNPDSSSSNDDSLCPSQKILFLDKIQD